jgi:pimeloyl-ACP methyl ester carboxylesterase
LGEIALSIEEDNCCLWSEYYEEFPCFSDQTVRPGCHPRKLLHNNRTEKAIVLVHGLTDSPFYMTSIAEFFHQSLGYNVYMPLLQCHGLKHPAGMAGVSLAQWKKNVRFAIHCAAENGARVSVGGLSMGGTLSLYLACTGLEVTGDLYLFSGALGLYVGRFGIFGSISEFLLRFPIVRFLDNGKPLIGKNPYRYDRVHLNSAVELVRLILEIDGLLKLPGDAIQAKNIFAAWSESDKVVNLKKLSELQYLIKAGRFVPFIIPKAIRVDHACVVLKEPVYARDSQPGEAPMEEANPMFNEMMAVVRKFGSAD